MSAILEEQIGFGGLTSSPLQPHQQSSPSEIDYVINDLREKKRKALEDIKKTHSGRNAFEIRSDIMQMAVDYGMKYNISDPHVVVNIAKLFYDFVENKRKI